MICTKRFRVLATLTLSLFKPGFIIPGVVLKGRWETKERDEIAHFLINHTPNGGSVSIASKRFRVGIRLQGGKIVDFTVNGKPITTLWEIKGTLLSLLEESKANFVIADGLPVTEGHLNVSLPFTAIMMEVLTLRDTLADGKAERYSGILRLHCTPRGGDREEFVRSIRLRYKDRVPFERLYKDFYYVLPAYINRLISGLREEGCVSLETAEGTSLSPVLLFLLVLLVSALSGFVSFLLFLRIM